jgi:hypothetical protein
MFGLLQIGLGLTLFALGSRLLPSGQASLIATLEAPLMPFRALGVGALVMSAVVADIIGDMRTRPETR